MGDNAHLMRSLSGAQKGVSRFAHGARRAFDGFRNSILSIQGAIAGLGLGMGIKNTIEQMAQMDKSTTRLKQTIGASAEEIKNLRRQFFELGKQTGQTPEDLQAVADVLAAGGLSAPQISATLPSVSRTLAISQATPEQLGSALISGATAFGYDLAQIGKAEEMLGKMVISGRQGRAELNSLPDIFARIAINAKSAGFGFEQTMAFVEGLSLFENKPDRLATISDSVLRLFNNIKYMDKAVKGTELGKLFFSKEGERRDPFDVFGDLRKKVQQLKTAEEQIQLIGKTFGEMDQETVTGLRALLTTQGLLEKMRSFAEETKQTTGIPEKEFREALDNLIDQAGRLKVTLREAAEGFVAPLKDALKEWIQFSLDEKKLTGKQMLVGGAAGAAGIAGAAMLGKCALGSVAKQWCGTAAGVAKGKLMESAAGVTPVTVTNFSDMPRGLTPGDVAVGFALGMSKWATAGIIAGTIAVTAGTMYTTVRGAEIVGKKLGQAQTSISSDARLEEQQKRNMVMGSGRSFIIDDELRARAGTQMGRQMLSSGQPRQQAMIPEIFRADLDRRNAEFTRIADDMVASVSRENADLTAAVKEIKPINDILLNIRIDAERRVITESSDMNTKVNTMVTRGSF